MGSSETDVSLEVLECFEKSTSNSLSDCDEDSINILITGFGPFRDHVINASWEAVKLIDPDLIPWPSNLSRGTPINISFCQLEVAYNTIHKHVPNLWEQKKPHLTIHVGVSGIAKALTLEQYAHNCGYCSPDVRESVPTNNICVKGGYEILQSGFNMTEIVNKLNLAKVLTGVKAELSHDPGRFLCDFTYYRSLCINKDRAAFIHVPPLDKPYSAKELSIAISYCVTEFLRQLQDKNLLL